MSCFSQSEPIHYYTDAEIVKLTEYVTNLEKLNPGANKSEADLKNKKEIMDLLNSASHAFTDSDVIKLNNYIKYLEKINDVVSATGEKTPSNDSLHAYTNAEITKLNSIINELEKRISVGNASALNAQDKQQITALLNNPSHEYTDAEVVKLSNYIKNLEKLDADIAIASAATKEKEKEKEIAVNDGKEYHLEEEKDIDKFEKLIFFNFNSSSLKEESYKPLDEVVKILKSYVNLHFVVEGYCDSIGSAYYNLSLSKRRAATVKNYFISKGVPSNRITDVGYGFGKPIASNETEEGRAQNRRVAIKARRK